MMCVKMARDAHRYKRDHFVDIAGYAELADRAETVEADDGPDV